ncbi:hypothetical protein DFH09DRAFT_1362516 [Mycena vulgaris]|nr:hypothetical protein DFH09DRAFT_1362516 [Mycena vulgaris]
MKSIISIIAILGICTGSVESSKSHQTPFPSTFDAYVPSNIQEFFSLSKLQPNYVPFETLRAVPLDSAHAASFEYAQKIVPHFGFIHSIRAYYFALAMLYNGFPSGTPGVPQIAFEELNRRIYHACILHDLGWTNTTEGLDHPAHAMSFEFHGGIMAYDHLHAAAPALDAIQVGDIVQSIFLHTSGWASGTSSATGMLMYLSAFFDVGGYDALGPGSFNSTFSRKTVQEIEKHYPRADFGNQTIEVLDGEIDKKPNCLISHIGGRAAIPQIVRIEPIVPVDEEIP